MKNIIKILSIILIIFVIMFLIWDAVYSKYVELNEIIVLSEIANPQIYVKMDEQVVVESLNEDVISCNFSVKNYDDTCSDIAFIYYISFNVDSTPLLIDLYEINGDEKREITLNNYMTVEAERLELGEVEKFYELQLEYDKDSNEVLEDDFKLNICLKAIQEEVS